MYCNALFPAPQGIFTNYAWTPTPHLQSSAQLAGAEGRRQDVYAGIDVHGRGTYGGGGFGAATALLAIREAGLSPFAFLRIPYQDCHML